jgi:hypothetical protein
MASKSDAQRDGGSEKLQQSKSGEGQILPGEGIDPVESNHHLDEGWQYLVGLFSHPLLRRFSCDHDEFGAEE